ncbi:hypothetical protein OKW30_008276 [Paraburkholderia sp. Clong3]
MGFLKDASFHYSWECKHAATASHDNPDDAATTRLYIWPPRMTRSCRPPPAFSCRDFPSPASRPASCRYASGSADVARIAPCPTGLPGPPWRYATEVVSPLPRWMPSLPGPTSGQRARAHQRPTLPCRAPSSAFPRITIDQVSLAMNDRAEVCPLSRRAMFQPVSRPLQPGIRFLRIPLPAPPTARLAVRLPIGQRYGLTLFHMILRMVRTRPMRRRRTVHDGPFIRSHSLPHTVFWFKPVSTFGLLGVTARFGRSHVLVVPTHPLRLSAFVLADSALPHG